MTFSEVFEKMKEKHKGNINFQFSLKNGILEIKHNGQPTNVIKVDPTGKIDASRWFGGANSNGPFIPAKFANNPLIENIERVIDRLLTISGNNIQNWKF